MKDYLINAGIVEQTKEDKENHVIELHAHREAYLQKIATVRKQAHTPEELGRDEEERSAEKEKFVEELKTEYATNIPSLIERCLETKSLNAFLEGIDSYERIDEMLRKNESAQRTHLKSREDYWRVEERGTARGGIIDVEPDPDGD